MRLLPLSACIACVTLGGCFAPAGASNNAIPIVRVQAASDLDCPQSEIRVTQMFMRGGQFEAIGCGHKAVYNAECEGLRCSVAPEGQEVPWRARPDPVPGNNP